MNQLYRVGNHQPRNIYRGDEYIGVMFSEIDAAAVVIHLNRGVGECLCEADGPGSRNEECSGQCCGVGACSCSAAARQKSDPESPKMEDRGGDIWYRVTCHGREAWTLDDQHDTQTDIDRCSSADEHIVFSFEQLDREWGPLRGVE